MISNSIFYLLLPACIIFNLAIESICHKLYYYICYYSIPIQYWNNINMEKKDPILPRMNKLISANEDILSFKVRQNLVSRQKQIKMQVSIQTAKAKNFLNKTKSFNSPSVVFALNESIRAQTNTTECEQTTKQHRKTHKQNKNFHNFGLMHQRSQKSFIQLHKKQPVYYAQHRDREKANELSNWMTEKLKAIKFKQTVTLDDILDYNQTVVNYGLGEIIQSVRKRCKEEAETLKNIWDNTIVLFQNLLEILTDQIRKKEELAIFNEKQIEKIYLTNLSFLKNKNQQLQKHLEFLYQKMKKVILWNRRLRKDRYKQQITLRVKNYRLSTYESALQETTKMLLSQSNQPNCLILAKKIVSKLYKINCIKRKPKPMEQQSFDHVHEKAKQFVLSWLKKYSFEDDQKINNSVYLSQDEKLQIIKFSDQKQVDYVDIYDYFQTKSNGVQTEKNCNQNGTQYENEKIFKPTKTVAIQTKRVMKTSLGVQTPSNIDNEGKKLQKNRSFQRKNSKIKNQKRNARKNTIQKKSSIVSTSVFQNNSGVKSSHKKTSNKAEISKKSLMQLQRKKTNQSNIFEDEEVEQQYSYKSEESFLKQICQSSKNSIDYEDFQQQQELQKEQNYSKNQTNINNKLSLFLNARNNYGSFSRINDDLDIIIAKNAINPRNKNLIYTKSQRFISQPNENQLQIYRPKQLQFKKFSDAYESQMKAQLQNNKQQIIATVIRRRSFYKSNRNRKHNTQKQMFYLWYRPNKRQNILSKQKNYFNQIDQRIYNYFNNLSKSISFPLNFSKSKIYQQTCNFFSNISSGLANTSQKPIPKNKQFINFSITSITKFISRLIFDYLRKIRGDLEGYYVESEKVFYPLSIILVDNLIHKYGLKDIAQKKLKDFMQKLSTFIGVSDRINFFYKLLGVGEELIGSDQLIIYMKCLVCLDIKRTVPIMNINKDFTVQRMMTDKQTVLREIDPIISEFFVPQKTQQVKWKIQKYFITYQLPQQFDIERIAALIIDQFVAFKRQKYSQYLPIYKNCQGNFFPNLFKITEMVSGDAVILSKNIKKVEQIFKNSDILDEFYGKSISQLKFIGMCVKLGFPNHHQIRQKLTNLKQIFIQTTGMQSSYSIEGDQIISKLKKKYNIKISFEKQAPDYWLYTCAQIGYQIADINSTNLLGNLKWFHKSPNC